MSQSQASPTPISGADARPEAGARPAWTTGRVAALVIGALLALLA